MMDFVGAKFDELRKSEEVVVTDNVDEKVAMKEVLHNIFYFNDENERGSYLAEKTEADNIKTDVAAVVEEQVKGVKLYCLEFVKDDLYVEMNEVVNMKEMVQIDVVVADLNVGKDLCDAERM